MDQATAIFLLGTFLLFMLLCALFLGAQWAIVCLLYAPLPPKEPEREDLYNDPTQEVRAIRP